MSFLTQSHQVFFGHPLSLIPSTSHIIQCLTQLLSFFRSTCPNHLNLLFLIIKLTGSNPKSSLSSSLFFLDSAYKLQSKVSKNVVIYASESQDIRDIQMCQKNYQYQELSYFFQLQITYVTFLRHETVYNFITSALNR